MVEEFNKWRASIGNIYYSDDNKMARAFEIVDQHEEI
jgi:hypothetical protein